MLDSVAPGAAVFLRFLSFFGDQPGDGAPRDLQLDIIRLHAQNHGIIGVHGDPLTDITTFQRVPFVMKDGKAVKVPGQATT